MKYHPCNHCSEIRYDLIRPYPGWEGIDLVQCLNCGLMQAQPLPSDEFLWNFYQTTFGHDGESGFDMTDANEKHLRLRPTLQFDFIRRHCDLSGSPGKRVLDVGCHAGSFLFLFKQRGWEVTGVDPNPRSRYAEEWYGIKVIERLFEKGMFSENSFDAILHSHALEHVRDPKGYLSEFYRILKPGGWAFIEVPNDSRENVAAQKVTPHLYFFTPKTLGAAAQSAGFRVKRVCVLGVNPRKAPLWSAEGARWLLSRLSACYDARGRLNLLTMMPFFGKIFKEDRYFKNDTPKAAMLRALLEKKR